MAGIYIVASDLGSQSIKTALYNTDGQLLGTSNVDTKIHTLGPGALVYQGDEFYQLTSESIKQVVKKLKVSPKEIAVISFTGMGGGIIGIDEHWKPTSEYTNPLDSRDQPYFEEVMKNY